MDQPADLSRRLESLIRLGTIADVQMKPLRVRVKSGQLTTDWLTCFCLRAGRVRRWSPPTKDEQCIVFSPSGETGAGIVLVGLPSDLIPPPSDSPDEDIIDYPDGARITYNHATSALSVTGIKTANVQADVKVTVDCPKTEFTGDVDILGKLTVNGETLLKALLSYMAGMSGKGGSGKTVIEGNIEHRNGKLSSNGVVIDEHTHPEHDGPNTEKPNK
ncbi:phage baseplate assembly protein V [Crenobacter sp. SG2303]|uniref:Phage baseplate assembly protein V n=1 Tax=Crenobacter oryzisoli TaxID=3056844 RepID=A0ABT7XP79_9NEIS|nr:phage baseplate assembly protein V [Crenobacter sp. SG2303]MDN0075598.1 phage baseplate assembly protein V [Crenobacter sp. SG2303]